MTATVATIAGHRLTHGTVYLPAWGLWFADVATDGEHELSGAVDLVFNDVTFKGTVLSGGAVLGRSYFRVVGGKGGWGRTLPRKSYASDAGVKRATVVGDAAREAGETLDASTVPAEVLGPAWTRDEDQASRVLESVSPAAWYVGADGVTRLGARAATTFAGQAARVTPLDKAQRTLTLAAEQIAALVPGVVADGLAAIDVVHEISPKGLRTTIYGKGTSTYGKLLEARRKQLDALDPDRLYRGTYEYRVVTLTGNRVNLQPVLRSTGMPDLQRIPLRPGVAGANPTCALGSKVLVAWVNGDRARPVVTGFEDPDGDGFLPTSVHYDAQTTVRLGLGVLPVARQADVAGIYPITTTQTKVVA